MDACSQQGSGEERVTAIQELRNEFNSEDSVVSSTTLSSPGMTWYEHQDPGKSVVADDQLGQLDRHSPARCSKSDYDRSWSSQEWRNEVTAHDRWKLDETS